MSRGAGDRHTTGRLQPEVPNLYVAGALIDWDFERFLLSEADAAGQAGAGNQTLLGAASAPGLTLGGCARMHAGCMGVGNARARPRERLRGIHVDCAPGNSSPSCSRMSFHSIPCGLAWRCALQCTAGRAPVLAASRHGTTCTTTPHLWNVLLPILQMTWWSRSLATAVADG